MKKEVTYISIIGRSLREGTGGKSDWRVKGSGDGSIWKPDAISSS